MDIFFQKELVEKLGAQPLQSQDAAHTAQPHGLRHPDQHVEAGLPGVTICTALLWYPHQTQQG